jgi:hypothetical protein
MPKQTALAAAVKKLTSPDEWVKAKPQPQAATAKPARLVVEIPDAMHARIKIKCAEQRIKIKDATERLFQLWLDGKIQV